MTTKPVLLLALGVLAALTLASTAQVVTLPGVQLPCTKQCGREANNTVCGDNHCCSGKGFCGLGPKYCDTGCQSGACFDNARCDAATPCPNNQCCSPHGYCGFGEDYCGSGCSNGPCNTDHSCDNSDLSCPNNLCCRGWDKKCGLGGNYCTVKDGDDAANGCRSGPCYKKRCGSDNPCTNDYCCSASVDGYCGIDQAYCGGNNVISVGGVACVLPPS